MRMHPIMMLRWEPVHGSIPQALMLTGDRLRVCVYRVRPLRSRCILYQVTGSFDIDRSR